MNLSVVVTTHNRSHLLPDCLRSILDNNIPYSNVLVVDDSDQLYHQYINKLTCAVFSIPYKFIPNSGLASSRNFAFGHFSTQFVTFLDDDDRWPPNYISSILELLVATTDIFLSYPPSCFKRIHFDHYPYVVKLYDLFYAGLTPPVGLQIYNKDLFVDMQPYNSLISSGVDHDLWINLLHKNPSVVLNPIPINITSISTGVSLTTNYKKRLLHINDSLSSWSSAIIASLGHTFFIHFKHSYRLSLDDLLYHSILCGDISNLKYFRLDRFFFWTVRRLLSLFKSNSMFPPYNK